MPLKHEHQPADTQDMAKAALSAAFSKASGSIGAQVVSRGKSGLALRGKPTYKYPKNAAVQAGSNRLKAANQAWNTLTVAQFDAWNAYAGGLTHHNDLTGEPYHPSGKNAFVGLAIKFLQVNPALSVPLNPPSGSFLPDSVMVSCAAVSGGLRFTASDANRAGVVTEILVQPLLNARRSPTQFYKSAAFVAFVAGGLTATVPVPAGWYATAYRFVESATGRTTPLMRLGKLQVL